MHMIGSLDDLGHRSTTEEFSGETLQPTLISELDSASVIALIKREIVEDRNFSLTHDWLLYRFQQAKIDPSSKEATLCYETAENSAHPYLRPPTAEVIKVHDYTLNFFWINQHPQDRLLDLSKHIFKNGENEEDFETFFTPLSQWAMLHEGATMNLWYDSALVTEKAQKQTFLKTELFSAQNMVNLHLRDLRELKIQEEILERAFHPSTPLYYRVDLLKALVTDHLLTTNQARYAVILDIDIEPSSPGNFFDRRTLQHLDSKGYVFNSTPGCLTENSGMIFDRTQTDLASDHYKTVLASAASDLNHLQQFKKTRALPTRLPGHTSIYEKYSDFTDIRREWGGEPRKPMKCPRTQFNGGSCSPEQRLTHQDKFWFEEGKMYPNVLRKNNDGGYGCHFINDLEEWVPEPLYTIPDVVN